MQRFTSLDAFRGGAALGVAIYHWAIFTGGPGDPPIGNFYLFIDFFFVLSGFFIAAIYREQISDGASAARFLLLRLARVYPVHVFMLAAFLMVATIGAFPGGAPFAADGMSADGFVAHLLLIQPSGSMASWNQPAWIISVEMQLCVLFAFLCLAGVTQSALGRICLGAAIAATLGYLAKQHGDLNITTADAFARGFVGFGTGLLLHSLSMLRWASSGLYFAKRRFGSAVEIAALVCIAAFLALADRAASFAAPFLFAAVILVFLDDQGAVSRVLRRPLFLHLGALSYAIYMAHFLFIPPIQAIFSSDTSPSWAVALGLIAYLILTIGLSFCIHRLIEEPTRQAMRVWIDRRMPSRHLLARLSRSEGWTPPPPRR